jgi:hypothetical protein
MRNKSCLGPVHIVVKMYFTYIGPFRIFLKFAEKFAAQGVPPVSLTPVANEKNLQSEKF